MQLGYFLNQEQNVKLFMTPELKQSIHILQLSNTELTSYLQELATENPLIEIEWTEAPVLRSNSKSNHQGLEGMDWLGNLSARKGSLENWIVDQLRMTEYALDEFKAVSFLAGNLDDSGYLAIELCEAGEKLGLSCELMDRALMKLQSFDPAGIGGRCLQECLLLQVFRDKKAVIGAEKVIRDYLQELAKGKFSKISKDMDISEEHVSRILEYIRTLNPRPGLVFASYDEEYLIVDAELIVDESKYVIEMNNKAVPKVTINKQYADFMKQAQGKDVSLFYQEKMKAVEWLIRSLDHRYSTLFRVTCVIVEEQFSFFEGESGRLKPMSLRDISQRLEVHESTVSRAIRGKYIHTPRGIYELKFFFTNGLRTDEGDEVSSTMVKGMIREFICREERKNPLSDQKIMELLCSKGVQISRRTVAKYREEEHILSSAMRRNKIG